MPSQVRPSADIHNLAPVRFAGFVLANGSMSSKN